MSTNARRVRTAGQERDHVQRHFSPESRALCGKKPFPERWHMPVVGKDKALCPACVRLA